jgi:nucleotide-binding universal stress UspA family protein
MKDIRTILLTTDLSEISKQAVDVAAMLAKKFDAKVIVTYVGELFQPHMEQYWAPGDFETIKTDAFERAKSQLAEFAARSSWDSIPVELVVPVGVPHVEIVSLAEERGVDLIVMAPHGRGFVSHLILGSTTERVLRHAPCPVLVVREKGAS